MLLTSILVRSAGSRLFHRATWCAALAVLWTLSVVSAAAPAPTPPPQSPADPLGNLVVTPGATRTLPRIAIEPSLSSDLADVILHGIVARDLDLSGEFDILPDTSAPDGGSTADTVDVDAWAQKGALAVVKIGAATSGDKVSFAAQVYFTKKGSTPVLERKATTTASSLRAESHRLSDALIGALTGQDGGFYSHLTFTAATGPVRAAYVMDSDGHDLHAVSSPDELVISSTFGKNEEVYWISSTSDDPYQIRTKSSPIPLPIRGSAYGLAFSKDRSQVAVSIGTDMGIKLFTGKDFTSLQPASPILSVMSPSFTPSGKLVFSGAGRSGQRIYFDGKAISPEGMAASSPTVCNHPEGLKVVFAAGSGRSSDLVVTSETGGNMVRLTRNQGSNSAPACSPDGRLVAFFSTRSSGDGPGLYLMRTDGGRAKRISTFTGDSLRWDPLPLPPPLIARASP